MCKYHFSNNSRIIVVCSRDLPRRDEGREERGVRGGHRDAHLAPKLYDLNTLNNLNKLNRLNNVK